MGGHETGADDRLTVADSGINGRDCEDPLLEKTLGKGKGLGLASDEDRDDGCLRASNIEANRPEALVHLARVTPEEFDTLRLRLHDFKGLENASSHSWRERGGEDEATGLVLEELDHLPRSGDEATHRAKRLRESPHNNVHFIIHAKVMNNALTLRTKNTERMSLIHIHDGIVFLRRRDHRRQIGNISGHAEDSVHDDESSRLIGDALETVTESLWRVVLVGDQLCWSHLATLDDRGVVLAVTQNHILGFRQGGQSPLIGEETSRE